MKRFKPIVTLFLIVVLMPLVISPMALAAGISWTYTLNADFDNGVLFNVNHTVVADQLQLNEQQTTYPVMWIANAGEDTVSKWDTSTNK